MVSSQVSIINGHLCVSNILRSGQSETPGVAPSAQHPDAPDDVDAAATDTETPEPTDEEGAPPDSSSTASTPRRQSPRYRRKKESFFLTEEEQYEDDLEAAATRIQSAHRGKRARERVDERRRKLIVEEREVMEALVKGEKARTEQLVVGAEPELEQEATDLGLPDNVCEAAQGRPPEGTCRRGLGSGRPCWTRRRDRPAASSSRVRTASSGRLLTRLRP